MHSINRNSFLHEKEKFSNARLINRCVDLARNKPVVSCFDSEPPFNRLCSHKPCILLENVDVTRRPVAFGRWALPKLRKELHSCDPDVVLKAAASISDLVHDPEKAFEAICLNIPKRMADLVIHDNPSVREYVLLAYTTISGLEEGRMAIVKNQELLNNLLEILEGYPLFEIRIKAAKCLEVVSRSWICSDYLVENHFVQKILKLLSYEFIESLICIYLEILQHLMYGEGKEIAIQNDGFALLLNFLERRNMELLKNTLDCMLLLTSTTAGKRLAKESKLLKTLEKLLKYESRLVYQQENIIIMKASAAGVLMFCTIETRAKVSASKLEELPKILIDLAKIPNRTLQIYCLRSLTNICEHWRARKLVKDNYCDEIANITLIVDEEFRTNLFMIINWVPTSNT